MDIATGIIVFIVVAIICIVFRVLCIITCRNLRTEEQPRRIERRVIRRIRIDPVTATTTTSEIVHDRQGNAFTVTDETHRDNRYNDIFFIEPNSPEAARIRAQLEKDDKDLPSYDDVIRMTSVATPTTLPAADNFVAASNSALSIGASSSSINTTDTTLTVPPYVEVNPNVSSSSRPLTPPPYTAEPPAAASVMLPINTPLHAQTQTHNS